MVSLALSVVAYIRAFFVPRHQLALEAAALRQQLAVFKPKQTRLGLHRLDRFFWTAVVIKTYWVPKIALRDSTDLIVVAERSLGKRWIESGHYGSAATGLLSKSSSA